MLAVFWCAGTTYAGVYFNWSWSDNFKTTYPNLSDGLYLLIQHIAYDILEYLALEFGQWLGDESKSDTAPPVVGAGGETDPLLPPSQNQG